MTYKDAAVLVSREVASCLQFALGLFLAGVLLLGFFTLDGLVHAVADRMSAPPVEAPRPIGPPTYEARGPGQRHVTNAADFYGFYYEPPSTYDEPVSPYDEPLPIVPPPPSPWRPRMAPARPTWHPPKSRVESARPETAVPLPPPPPARTPPPAVQAPVKAVASPPPALPPASAQPTRYDTALGTLQNDWQAVRNRLLLVWQIDVVAVLVLAAAFTRWGIEILAIAVFTVREWAAAVGAALQSRVENWRRRQERKARKDQSEKEFRRETGRRTRRIEKLVRRSDILYAEADRLEATPWGPAFVVRRLRRRAGGYIEAAEREQDELERAERLWAELEQARRAAKDAETAEHVRMQLRLLSSKIESAATRAFAELRKIGSSFDWNAILPDGLPAEARERIIKLLRVVAGAGNLAEAQAAYGRALHILNSHNASWGGRAA